MIHNLLGVAVVALLAMSAPTIAQNITSSRQDPRELYFSNVTIPVPDETGDTVLQSEFDPRPDSGEESYVGGGLLTGRRALITGGDSGISRAIAIAFAREGADVTINYLPDEQSDAEEVEDIIGSTTHSSFFAVPGDLRNATFCSHLVEEAASRMNGLDILVNNAGWTSNRSPNITSLPIEVFERTLHTNVFAPCYLTRAAVELMPPGSSILFTVSRSVDNPVYMAAHYAASKAFIGNYVRGIATGLLSQNGIRVNGVAPGMTYTPFMPTQGMTSEIANSQLAEVPGARPAQPVEIARTFVALVTHPYAFGAVWEV